MFYPEVPTEHLLNCACFGPRHSPYSFWYSYEYDIAAAGLLLKIFSYDRRNLNPLPSRRRVDVLRVAQQPWVT